MKLLDQTPFHAAQGGGCPCNQGMRIRDNDVPNLLAVGALKGEILHVLPYFQAEDVLASLENAAWDWGFAQAPDHPAEVVSGQ